MDYTPGKYNQKLQERGHWVVKLERLTAPNECTRNRCNPLNLTTNKPRTWNEDWKMDEHTFSLQIDSTGSDPGTLIYIKIQEVVHSNKDEERLFHSFYHEMETGAKYEIPTIARNLFVNLAENRSKVLNISNCYICGGTSMGEQWPWGSKEINITANNIWNSSKVQRAKQWALQTSIIGQNCRQKPPGRQGKKPVGSLTCENSRIWNETITK